LQVFGCGAPGEEPQALPDGEAGDDQSESLPARRVWYGLHELVVGDQLMGASDAGQRQQRQYEGQGWVGGGREHGCSRPGCEGQQEAVPAP
jgi:hypothetical protein